jgi:flagellar biosynthesis/type III secretory pathway protein FliH
MKSNNLLKNIKNIGLALSLLVGFMLFSGSNAQAQYQRQNDRQNDRQDNDRYDNNGSRMYKMAVQKGYEDGLKQGLREARGNRNSDAEHNAVYGIAGRGYQSRRGNRSDFQIAYREGFTRGYNEAFQRYQNNNRNKHVHHDHN